MRRSFHFGVEIGNRRVLETMQHSCASVLISLSFPVSFPALPSRLVKVKVTGKGAGKGEVNEENGRIEVFCTLLHHVRCYKYLIKRTKCQ